MNRKTGLRRCSALLCAAAYLLCAAVPVYAEPNDGTAAETTAPAATADPVPPDAAPPDAAETTAPVPTDPAVTDLTTGTTETSTTETTAATSTAMPTPDPLDMIEYEETEDGGIRLTYFRWTNEDDLVIPDEIDGKPITEIGKQAFQYCYAYTVTLPDTVTSIGESAFAGCAYLQSMQIPASCVCIDDFAFQDCTALETVEIPAAVEEIGWCAFDNTPFYRNQEGDFVILGDGILYAYRGSDAALVIPDTVKTIGAFACADHHVLKSVTIPGSVRRVLTGAFDNCENLSEIQTPDVLELLAADAFRNTKWYQKSKEDYLVLGQMLVAYLGKNTVAEVPEGIRVINESAFEGNAALTTVVLPDSVTEIRRAAFYRCTSLQVAELSDALESVGDRAFWGCDTLNYLRLGYALESVGDHAFAGCPYLEEVYLPDTLQQIGDYAFGFAWNEKRGQYDKIKNNLILYSNAEAAGAYAAAHEVPLEPLPEAENTEPPPVVTTLEPGEAELGTPSGIAWVPAGLLGSVLILVSGIMLAVRSKKYR